MNSFIIILFLFLECAFSRIVIDDSDDDHSNVASTTEDTIDEPIVAGVLPHIYSMQIHTNVSNRFARTLITSKARNGKKKAEQTTFSIILPENAFISEFEMEIKDKVYKAHVKEKKEAKNMYQEAVSQGQSAAHIEESARDSKTFTVSVNIAPESKVIFRLVYEELLHRELERYELVVNIHPGQTVEDFGVQVYINESRPLSFVRTPSLRTGNEISKNDPKLDPSAKIDIDGNTATVKFVPDVSQQKEFGQNLGGDKEKGLAGQFVVEYDVERDPKGGEVLVRDGYFVHFFAPSDLKPLPKHVVFVLDHSGSMAGRKFEQLVEAMKNILPELKTEDLFNIVRFADGVAIWDTNSNDFVTVNLTSQNYGNLEPQLRETHLADAAKITPEILNKVKKALEEPNGLGMTNMIGGLEIGLFVTKKTQEQHPDKYQPMIVFLTDGFPTVGMRSTDQITKTVTRLNSETKVPIYTLSFGDGADKDFLRKLSSQNLGFSRHIYEASDASLQLQDFYRAISAPLLSNITFKYVDSVSQVTKTHYPMLFKGSELVVAGKTGNSNISPHVSSVGVTGSISFNTTHTEPVGSLERLWAYLTVKQILAERELPKKALDLSLKYSFVTEVSSLVVVKPDEDFSSRVCDSNAPIAPQVSLGAAGQSGQRRRGPMGGYYMHRKSPQPPTTPFPGVLSTTRRQPIPTTAVTHEPDHSSVPQWLDDLRNTNGNITTPQGTFKLGQSGVVNVFPSCEKTPVGGSGECKILFDCPQVFLELTNMNVYLQYFCPLNEFAGVCCPGASGNSTSYA